MIIKTLRRISNWLLPIDEANDEVYELDEDYLEEQMIKLAKKNKVPISDDWMEDLDDAFYRKAD